VFGAAIVADREVADVVSNLPGHGPAVRAKRNCSLKLLGLHEIASEMKIRQQGIRVSGLPRVFDYSVEAGYSYGRQHGRDRHSRKQLRYRKSSLSIYLQQAGSAPNKECAVLGLQQSVRRCREWFSAMSAFCVR
jgi:hypothetical protein